MTIHSTRSGDNWIFSMRFSITGSILGISSIFRADWGILHYINRNWWNWGFKCLLCGWVSMDPDKFNALQLQGNIYRNALYFMVKSMVSDRFSFQSTYIHQVKTCWRSASSTHGSGSSPRWRTWTRRSLRPSTPTLGRWNGAPFSVVGGLKMAD